MEGLSPSMSLLLQIKRSVDQGVSIRRGLDAWLSEEVGSFRDLVFRWRGFFDSGSSFEPLMLNKLSPWRRALLEIIGRGLSGEPIGKALEGLEEEMMRAAEAEIQEKLTRLPYLIMIPVLLLQLPGFLLLLFGPLVHNFLHSLAG